MTEVRVIRSIDELERAGAEVEPVDVDYVINRYTIPIAVGE